MWPVLSINESTSKSSEVTTVHKLHMSGQSQYRWNFLPSVVLRPSSCSHLRLAHMCRVRNDNEAPHPGLLPP